VLADDADHDLLVLRLSAGAGAGEDDDTDKDALWGRECVVYESGTHESPSDQLSFIFYSLHLLTLALLSISSPTGAAPAVHLLDTVAAADHPGLGPVLARCPLAPALARAHPDAGDAKQHPVTARSSAAPAAANWVADNRAAARKQISHTDVTSERDNQGRIHRQLF
jgi:hypothetical protein